MLRGKWQITYMAKIIWFIWLYDFIQTFDLFFKLNKKFVYFKYFEKATKFCEISIVDLTATIDLLDRANLMW